MWARFYTKIYAKTYENEWQYGYQQMIDKVKTIQNNQDLPIFISRANGRPAMYYWFFTKTDPNLVQQADNLVKKDQGEFLEFENLKFINSANEVVQAPAIVILTDAEQLPRSYQVNLLEEVKNLNDEVVWKIYYLENN